MVSKNDLGLAEIEIEENGKTLEENAIKKSYFLGRKVREYCNSR